MAVLEKCLDMRRFAIALVAMSVLLASGGAMSQVTSLDTVTVTGVLVEGGIVCPLLELDTGERVPLMGAGVRDYAAGTRLEIKGVYVQRSPCQQGRRTLRVERITAVDGVTKD
jgi:hypothetical protein